jgi:hypothetical protein
VLRTIWIIVCILVVSTATAQGASYDIEVTLDPETHRLSGAQTIQWTNRAGEPTQELWFHLYLNAFANDRTTFMKGIGGGTLRGAAAPEDRTWGWTRVTSIRNADGADLSGGWTFERPDDGNPDDYTVARLALPEPVVPGATVELSMRFEAQLPTVIARTGFKGDYHLVGQWFPKLGVFEPAGRRGREAAGWNCHQFHPNSEFYADFGTYRVRLMVPVDWVVGATGVRTAKEAVADGGAGLSAHEFVADRVHDFAWTAAPPDLMTAVEVDFQPGRDVPAVWLERASRLLGRSTADLELPELPITLILPREHEALSERMARATRLGVAWYGLFYGPYPHPHLTVVTPPINAMESGGMEYPMFITGGASRLMTVPPFKWLSFTEVVIVHEFGHQYFQGIVASNEFEDAWLDEGLNSYAETMCMEAIDRDDLVPELVLGTPGWGVERSGWSRREDPLTIARTSWEFRTGRDYGQASYTKPALVLRTLEGLLGEERFARAMRAYVERWAFDHPGPQDFFDALSESAAEDLQPFFDQAILGDAVPDWAIRSVRHRRASPPKGVMWDGEAWLERPGDETEAVDDGDERWTIRVDILRRGDFRGPVELLLVFGDGTEERREWDGQSRWHRVELESTQRLEAAVVDPDGVWALETARADNYWRASPDGSTGRERAWWVPAVLRLAGLAPVLWS